MCARVIYSTVLMGEEEQGGGGWHDNLQQAGDLVAMATKQGCLHQRQISAVGSGGHICRSTNSNGGLSGPEIGVTETGERPFVPYRLSVPPQPLLPQQDRATRQAGGPV